MLKSVFSWRKISSLPLLIIIVSLSLISSGSAWLQSSGEESGPYDDVLTTTGHADSITRLKDLGVFDGTECADNKFCPHDPIARQDMAVWLIRLVDGTNPARTGQSRFTDVDASSLHSPFIERLAELKITVGCGTGKFCPETSVNRSQMAAFLTRAYALPAGPPANFTDVDPDGWSTGYINSIANVGITVGCSSKPLKYCPGSATTRGQMATFLSRAIDWQNVEGEVAVNGHDDSIGLKVTYNEEKYEATASWSAPSATRGQVKHYVLQSRLILEDFGSKFYQIVESSDKSNYQGTVSNATNSHYLYAFRVIVVYENGQRLATTEVKTPGNVHKLRDIIKEKVVEPKQDEQPWLSDVWVHINDSSRFGIGFGEPRVTLNSEYPYPAGLKRTFAGSLNVGSAILYNQNNTKIKTLIHELGHVYTYTNGVSEDSAPIGIGYLYLGLLSANHAVEAKKPNRCSPHELYADLAVLAFFDLYSSFSPNKGLSYGAVDDVTMGYWYNCGFRLDQETSAEVTTEIPAIVKSVFVDQEIPRWFYDTYQKSEGSIDLEKLWSDINVDNSNIRAISIIAYHLRDEFGGYCSEEQVRKFIEGKAAGINNPWKDGGCKDNVIVEDAEEGEAPSPASTTSSSTGQTPDISSLIRNGTYGSYRLVFLQNLRNRPDSCWIAIRGYVYDVTPRDEGYDYPGPGQITDLCGQDASDHFSSNNLNFPPLEYLKGHLRSS